MSTSNRLAAATLIVLVTACSRGEQKATDTARPSAPRGDTAKMAEMPGMSGKATGSDGDTKSGDSPPGSGVSFTAAQVQHGRVAWEPASMGTSASVATVPGQLVPNEDRTARLGAPARGRVVAVRVQPGDHVAKGQLLVTLQSPEAGMAQSDVAKSTAEVSSRRAAALYARTARDRAERLLVIKAIPRQDYERAVADDEAARASFAQAEAESRRARSTAQQLGADESTPNGEIALRSPLSGVVLQRLATAGTVVEAGAPMIIVTDPASLWLQVSAPEKFAGMFRIGDQLRFTVPAFADETYAARVTAVGAGLDPDTRTLAVRGTVPSAGKLKVAMLASVFVEGSGRVAAVLLPEDAVQLVNGKPTVFLAVPDGKGGAHFEARVVELGSRAGGRVAVLRGIAKGDVVVTRGAVAVRAQIAKRSMPKMEM
jgi:cobalt-zinc-cadmium efflux system membrane fusion protein